MIQIIPAVLATSEQQYNADISKLSSVEPLSEGWVHIDFADNIFVQNKTIEPEVIAKFPTNFRKEAHLMIAHPKDWIDRLIKEGFERIIFHIESADNIFEVIEDIKNKGLEAGLAINQETPVEKLEQFVSKIDVVLVMTIVAGFQGQLFIPSMLDKVKKIKSKNWSPRIGVDGAVNGSNIKSVVDAGADYAVVGSYLLKGDIEESLESLRVELSK